jgi:hypothetical protein
MQLVRSTTLKWSPASHMKTDCYHDAMSECSHHCPKSRKSTVANDVEIERIVTLHTTVDQQAEQVTMRYSRCNDVEIGRIGTFHTGASQQAEQVRILTA